MRRFLVLFLLIAASSFPLPARTVAAADTSDAEAFVEQDLRTLTGADPVEMAGLYAEDGLILPPSGVPVRGREAIQKFWSGNSRTSLSFRTLQKDVCGDSGFFVGTYSARESRSGRFYPASPFTLLGSRSSRISMSGNFALCLRRGDDGNWKVASDMWTEIAWAGFVPDRRQEGRIVPAEHSDR